MFTLSSLAIIVIGLTISLIMSELFYRMKYPRVIGQLVTGLIFAVPLFKSYISNEAFADIKFLSDLGIIFLLLLAGMEIDLRQFRKAEKDSFLIAASCALLPFTLGVITMKAMDYSTITAVVMGSALALTAEGTTLNVLLEMRALRSKVGTIMVEAGIIDNLFEVAFLAVTLLLVHGSIAEIELFPVKLIMFVMLIVITYLYLPRFIKWIHNEHNPIAMFSTVLVIGLIIAVVSGHLGLGTIIGAFLAGVLIQLSDHDRKEEHSIINELKMVTFGLAVPFFFINIGLHFDYTVFQHNFWLVLVIIFVATISKVLGAMAVTPLTDLTMKQTYLIGWAMNSRGAIELVIAEIARANNLITIELYSAIVAMTIVSTLIFPIIMKRTVQGNRGILK